MNMKKCNNSTRKIHISSNFILSISLLIMFDILLIQVQRAKLGILSLLLACLKHYKFDKPKITMF
jgi:hypothetical protein